MIPAPRMQRRKNSLFPVFIPFAGCPHRCVFCSQNAQTGQKPRPLSEVLQQLDADLAEARNAGRGPYELGFFGGTFTALPEPWPERFLAAAARHREAGTVSGVRCSTRPDAASPETLARLRKLGLDTVELGIQSFDGDALCKSGRGYDGEIARNACENVRRSGLRLGIQLMPGLPGDRPGVFRNDVDLALRLVPDCVRLYPCVVMEDTPLADTWRNGEYHPWPLARAVDELADALNRFRGAGIPVIRMGLAPETEMNASLLDGPWHPAFGQSVKALALYRHLKPHLETLTAPITLVVPRRLQGELLGHANELLPKYEALGLPQHAIRFEERDDFLLENLQTTVDPEDKIR